MIPSAITPTSDQALPARPDRPHPALAAPHNTSGGRADGAARSRPARCAFTRVAAAAQLAVGLLALSGVLGTAPDGLLGGGVRGPAPDPRPPVVIQTPQWPVGLLGGGVRVTPPGSGSSL